MAERGVPFAPGPVLVLAPHADDESLGCGLLLASCWHGGVAAHVLCLTDGGASHPASRDWPRTCLVALRRDELAAAVAALGGVPARDVTHLCHPDAALHRVPSQQVADEIGAVVDRLGTRTLFVPDRADPHCDHLAAADAADILCRTRPDLRRLSYSIWARWHGREAPPTPHARRHIFDAPNLIAIKRRAIEAHASQRGLVVHDDPQGFAMPPGFADFFAETPEIFHEVLPEGVEASHAH